MKWDIEFSKSADSFLATHSNIEEILVGEIAKLIKKIHGQKVNINIKKLMGEWKGYYRIRKGKIRIILHLDYEKRIIFVEAIDFRGNVYK